MYPVCDRYGACKKLARLWPFIILCCCRAHCWRDFPDCAGRSWRGGRTDGSIAEICRLNTARLPCFRRRSRRRRRLRSPRCLRKRRGFRKRRRKASRCAQPSRVRRPWTTISGKGLSGARSTGGSPASVSTAWTAVGGNVHGTVARSGLDVLRWRLRGERRGRGRDFMAAQMRLLRRSRSGPIASPDPAGPEADHVGYRAAALKTLDELRPLILPRIHAPGRRADALRGP